MICVVRSGIWLSAPLKLCLLLSSCTLKIINLSKWCLKQQVSKLANLNAIFLLDDSQLLITYYPD